MSGPVETAAPLLVMRGVTKHFGGVQALRGVDFDLRRGEIHALLGENGAGKSTLMNILSGVFAPDSGEMLLDGQPVRFDDPRAAQAAGVATIFQELDLVPSLDVTANLFLGRELTRGGVLDRAAMREEAITRLSVVGNDIGVDQPVGELSVGRRQIVAIAKALTYASKILIMDEPTAALTASEVERLFAVMREIAARGVGIVYISHRLEEVPRVADRVTVMRDGQVAGVQPANAPQSELVRLLVGRPLDELYPRRATTFGKPVLTLEHARFTPRTERPGWQAPEDVSLVVRAGEIVGLAGIMGAGRTELLTALYGAAGRGKWSGVVEIDGAPARLTSIRGARGEGLGLVTDDRRGSGLLIRDTVGRNLVLTVLERVSPAFLMSRAARERAREGGDPRLRRAPAAPGDRGRRRSPAATSRRSSSPRRCSAIRVSSCSTSRRAASTSAPRARSTRASASLRARAWACSWRRARCPSFWASATGSWCCAAGGPSRNFPAAPTSIRCSRPPSEARTKRYEPVGDDPRRRRRSPRRGAASTCSRFSCASRA